MIFDFNSLGEMLSRPENAPFVLTPADLGMDGAAHPFVREGILVQLNVADNRWTFSAAGMAAFLARRLDLSAPREFGGVFSLGRRGSEGIFYSISPPNVFYGTHRDGASVILGANSCEIPVWWTGRAALASELFYLDDACEIVSSKDAVARLLPPKALPRHPARRRIHERRMAWLRFFVSYFNDPFLPSRIARGHVRFDVVRDWFERNAAPAPRSLRTYARDIAEFTSFDENTDLYDKREELIASLWKCAADRNFPHGPEIARRITELLLKLKKEESAATVAKPAEIGRAAWQWLPGGRRELAAVAR